MEDQRKNLLSMFNSLKPKLSSRKSELIDLKNIKVQNLTLQHEVTKLNMSNESLKDTVEEANEKSQLFPNMLCSLRLKEPLPALPKLSKAESIGTSKDITSAIDLNQTSTVFEKTKQADSTTKELLLTLMKEVKGLKEQINPSSKNSSSVSQTKSSKSRKNKQKAKFGPCKHCPAVTSCIGCVCDGYGTWFFESEWAGEDSGLQDGNTRNGGATGQVYEANLHKLDANVPNDANFDIWLSLASVYEDLDIQKKPFVLNTMVNKVDKGKGGSYGDDDEGSVEVKKNKSGGGGATSVGVGDSLGDDDEEEVKEFSDLVVPHLRM
ncbi:hypothetical protein Tco_0013498 [Tanacetum coccineum]